MFTTHGNTSKHYRYNTIAYNFTIERHKEEYTGISPNKIASTRFHKSINVNSP